MTSGRLGTEEDEERVLVAIGAFFGEGFDYARLATLFLALPILTDEHYILVSGTPGARDHRGWETDLLAGLDLG